MNDTLKVIAPFDGELLAELPLSTEAEIDQALSTAHALYRDRANWLKKSDRIAILKRAATIIETRREALAKVVSQESGKPFKDALIEVDRGSTACTSA